MLHCNSKKPVARANRAGRNLRRRKRVTLTESLRSARHMITLISQMSLTNVSRHPHISAEVRSRRLIIHCHDETHIKQHAGYTDRSPDHTSHTVTVVYRPTKRE